MKVVIDSNRVIAALIKDSTTRLIIRSARFNFYAPSFIKSEIYKYKKEILEKSRLNSEEFNSLLENIFKRINIIQAEKYDLFFKDSKNSTIDPKDFSYFAVCTLCSAEGIWTHDPHFREQKNIRIFTNIDMLEFIKEN